MLAPRADPPVPLLDLALGVAAVPAAAAAAASYVLENASSIGSRRSDDSGGEVDEKELPNNRYSMVGAPAEKCRIMMPLVPLLPEPAVRRFFASSTNRWLPIFGLWDLWRQLHV
jgi:hypothetical protein